MEPARFITCVYGDFCYEPQSAYFYACDPTDEGFRVRTFQERYNLSDRDVEDLSSRAMDGTRALAAIHNANCIVEKINGALGQERDDNWSQRVKMLSKVFLKQLYSDSMGVSFKSWWIRYEKVFSEYDELFSEEKR